MKGEPDVVTLDSGTHVITGKLYVNHGQVIIQGVAGTVVQVADSTAEANYGAFYSSAAFTDITIRNLEIDGNKAGQGAYVAKPALIQMNNTTGLLVQNCILYDSMGDGIQPTNCENVEILDCQIHDCEEHAIHWNGVTNGALRRCTLQDDGSSLITGAHGGVNNMEVTDNVIERPGGAAPAYCISFNDAPAGMRQNCLVTGNTYNLNGSKAILIAEDFDECEITNNVFNDIPLIVITVGNGATNINIHDNIGIDAGNIEWL